MELTNHAVTDSLPAEANLDNGSLSLSEHLSSSEALVDPLVHGIEVTEDTAQSNGLGLKLNLYVPAHPLIEPISPAEVTIEQCVLPTAFQETGPQPEATEEKTHETGDLTVIPPDTQSSQIEPNSDILTESAPNNTSLSDCSQECSSECSTDFKETQNDCVAVKETIQGTHEITSDPDLSKEPRCESDSPTNVSSVCTQDGIRKNIPPKKDKYAPLKIKVMPLTSSQISLQCQECHIIFQDHKSKERHIKISHPAEYAQCMLADALFACYVCDKHFACSADLKAHQSTHTEKERFKCPLCDEAFTRSCELTSHKKVHFNKQGYSCLECGKLCKTLSLLTYHQRVHGEKPYVCKQNHCGKKFTTDKSLKKHQEKHKEGDKEGLADLKNASDATKKRKNKGTNERKYKCLHCDAVFKTSKTQLLHIKNQHSQEKVMQGQNKTVSVLQTNPAGLIITQTTHGHPQTMPTEGGVPITQQIDVLDAEEIKRLIEKLDNVKKVNQLVILPFQTQGLMKPLHLDFTQSTDQPTECMQTDTDPANEQNNQHVSTEMEDLQQNETVVLSQVENIISSENSRLETQLAPAVLTEAQSQLDEVYLDLIPVQTETSVLLDQTPLQVQVSQSDAVFEQAHTAEFQHIPVTQDSLALETTIESPLIPLTETEKCQNVEENNASLTYDVTNASLTNNVTNSSQTNALLTNNVTNSSQTNDVVSEEAFSNADLLCSGQIQDLTDLDSQVLCGPTDTTKLGEPQELEQIQAQKDQVDPEKEPTIVKPQSQTKQPSLNNLQNSTSTDMQSKPRKKKKSSKPKVMTKPNKTKVKQNPILQKSEQDQVDVLAKHDSKQCFKQKVPKDKKAKGAEGKSEEEIKSTHQTNFVKDNVSVVPQATKTKPQKRKMTPNPSNLIKKSKTVQNQSNLIKSKTVKNQSNLIQSKTVQNQSNLIKKSETVQEAQQDETLIPVQKKKKKCKTPQEDCPNPIPKVKKPKKNEFQKNNLKMPKQKVAKKSSLDAPDQCQVEKQALLLLKGHKQPQLKVHKLDATELEKSPSNKSDVKEPSLLQEQEITPSKSIKVTKQKKAKLTTKNKLLEGQGKHLPMEKSSVDSSFTSSAAKPKISRKRKAPTKIDQEIALSPPYSRLTLGCQDCGTTFSEVSALQEHMASFHSAEKMAVQDEAVGVRKKSDMRTNEKHYQPNVFEIQVATDWEMGEILGDRDEPRLSFPVLSPSPSLTLPSNCVEGKESEGGKEVEGTVSGPEETSSEVCQVSTPATVESTAPQEVTENTESSDIVVDKEPSEEVGLITEVKDPVEEEIKEELPLDVNLVMVGDHNEENGMNILSSISSQEHEIELSKSHPCSEPEQTAKKADVALTENVVTESEVKQEEEETLVHRADDQKRGMGRSSAIRGKKGVAKGQGKRLVGKKTSKANRSKKDTEAKKDLQDCQVVYQFCVLNDTPEVKDKETDMNGDKASETCLLSSAEESPEDQVVFELDSVTTSVTEVMNSQDGSLIETSTELIRDDRSPGIILEKFLTARESQNQRTQANLELDTSVADVKIEERSSNQAPHSLTSERRVQMFLVKAEEHFALNEPLMFQAHQPTENHPVSCQDDTIDKNGDGISSDSHIVPLHSYSKQCIFYPVKEEEKEHLVESSHADQKGLDSEGLEGASSAIEECEEIAMDSVQMEMPHLYTNSEEGDVSAEQQSTQGFLEFLSQNSDSDESPVVHSEPEAETILMSCYHGIQSNATGHQNGAEICDPSGRQIASPSQSGHIEAEGQPSRKPINYFSQYFSWNTWSEIAVFTGEMSKLPNPVTEKEVAQYVGIHIAMGTLKFPSTKLYWEDFTRVPLISDAMSASRFWELTHTLKLASAGGPSVEKNSAHQSPEMNGDPSEPINKSQSHAFSCDTSRIFSQSCKEAHDPLWKVMMLINRVQEGCRALKRNGSFGVDQYPLPFQRHPTHSLLHTVVVNCEGLVVDFILSIDDSNRETVVEKMVSRGKDRNEGMVFLCKPELSTPSMLEHLLEVGVQSAGKVGGARGQIGDEFVSSDGKLKLFRCHHGFILSAVVKEKPRSTSLVSGFERAIKAANLNRDLRSLYRTPSTNSAVSAWPQSVLWDLIDLVLVNAWIQYKQDYSHIADLPSLMAFRLEVAKALILSSGVDAQDSSPPCPPAPKQHGPDTSSRPSPVLETPLPDVDTRYDGFGHWPEQLAESEEAKCRFGGCGRTSRVRCLKCCVFLCISRNHNCFLKFHSQGAL
ncbi:zinc finger protein 576, tandem duplicate 1 [Paramisgurnus dabryanus]|uniref:zinc finger protein 576, tandem duplicate 1 n=1 Tax=Paramisgurnus dabryanus TaxID=90735 RepID=UPI0031F38BBA